jgi:tetratricopeptide (TPR) repeat protein
MRDELINRRLITVSYREEKLCLGIHRLLQQKVLSGLGESKRQEVFHQALLLVRKRYPTASTQQIPDSSKWQDCKDYEPHVLSLYRTFEKIKGIPPTIDLAKLMYDAGFHTWERQGNAYDGLDLLKTSEKILDDINYDKNGRLRPDIYAMRGAFCDRIGISKRKEGLEHRQRALAIRKTIVEQRPDDNESELLRNNAASDLGISLLQINDYEEAGKLFASCYIKYREWGSEEDLPFEYFKHYSNTGSVRMYQGRFNEALEMLWRAVALSEKKGGKDWMYWKGVYLVACCLLQSGDLPAALDLHSKVLEARTKAYGRLAESSLHSCYAVGAMHDHMGSLQSAS